MEAKEIGFIGGGRIVQIFLKRMLNESKTPFSIEVCDTDSLVLEKIKNLYGDKVGVSNDFTKAASQKIVFIALHPPVFNEMLPKFKHLLRQDSIVISLAPKISSSKISELIGGHQRVARMLPNAPSIVGMGYNPVYFSSSIKKEDKVYLESIFNVFGEWPEIEESKIEAYAILCGMGPTYLWFQLYQLYDLGISFGLTEDELKNSLEQMVTGTTKTMLSSFTREEVLDLIPVKPISEIENEWKQVYVDKLTALYNKIKP
jgi:pyrroline-5-carboxylate reductase